MAAAAHPTGSRSKAEIADERRAKHDHTLAEIRSIVAEFHARLPRALAKYVGAAYARYSSRFQDSITDQVRAIMADAVAKSVFIPLEHVFFDAATRGCKNDREGLNALRDCLGRKTVRVVFFFATNRLFRKTYRSLQFVEEEVVEKGVRAVFSKSGIDTTDGKRWRAFLNMHAMMDEFVVGLTADHVRAAHEGLFDRRLVFGTVSFGYAGEPIDGETTRRGKPRQRLVIDPVAAEWVRTIFRWYVEEQGSVAEIVRRLNSTPGVPSPPRVPGGVWTRNAVRRLLRNARYRGWWEYGRTETHWVSSKDYSRQVPRAEPLRGAQIEELRLVPDDVWHKAQVRLDREVERSGRRPPMDGDRTSRPRVLDGLFWCAAHNRKLYVGGAKGKYLICKDCQALPVDRRPLFSQLPRQVALRATCEELAGLLRADDELVNQVVAAFQAEAAGLQSPNHREVEDLVARVSRLDRQINFVLRNAGDTDAEQAESMGALRQLRRDREAVQAERAAAEAAAAQPVVVPTEAEVRALVREAAGVLVAAATETDGAGAGLVRELIDQLTGGRIDVEQAGERRAKGGWVRGQFHCPLVDVITARLGSRSTDGVESRLVTVDYRAARGPDPAVGRRVVELYDAGRLVKQIACEAGLPRSAVTAILDAHHAAQGLVRPDGRTRRQTLTEKHTSPPVYRAVADRVKELADGGLRFGEIAAELGVDRNTVTRAWREWHECRRLSPPDGRTRPDLTEE